MGDALSALSKYSLFCTYFQEYIRRCNKYRLYTFRRERIKAKESDRASNKARKGKIENLLQIQKMLPTELLTVNSSFLK